MDTLSNIFVTSSTKSFLVQNSSGLICLIQEELDNQWFLATPVTPIASGYVSGGLFILLKGDQAIWSVL